jgi:hypothetical protein
MNIQEKQLIFFSTKNVENIKHNFLPMHFEIVVLLSVTVILFPRHLEQPVERMHLHNIQYHILHKVVDQC